MSLLPGELEFPPPPQPPITDTHLPHRPYWWCRACREDWPCTDAREALRGQRAEHPAQTRLYLVGQFEFALSELGDEGRVLWRRFVELREPDGAP